MSGELTPIDRAKFVAAKQATEYLESGMKVGLGTGSTAAWFAQCVGELVREEGLDVTCVATSKETAMLAQQIGLKTVALEEVKWLDLTVDGADEVDESLALIKGGGGALLREKIVATASERMIVIADASKSVADLGKFPLPVEVVPFGVAVTKNLISEMLNSMDVLGREITLRMQGDEPFVTDEGNFILDLHLRHIGAPRQLGLVLNQIPGVVENGLFIDICDMAIVGHGDGKVTVRDLSTNSAEILHYDVRDDDNIFTDVAD
ncbi:ribose-5-phosphate isomerase RpiA [Yoonia litorea]|uniref:Ribose-5-phosphate isomerase A n=1 Tax=Yoonia litorea TaxID=1123755 RepID=A0A1I6MGH3_9RHOB|nr:ribose-5-phosphate isomerase RpiA [Yoonia litorea]SFS14835.1 ribose-5-phosphate isomerase [Yoonia litorea]